MKYNIENILRNPEKLNIGDYILGVGQIMSYADLSFVQKAAQVLRAARAKPHVFIKAGKDILLPKRQYWNDSGLDLKAAMDVEIEAGQTAVIPSGVSIAIPPGWEGQVRPRSGLSAMGYHVVLGTIDAGYRGEIQVIMHNATDRPVLFRMGDRIAQLVIAPVWTGDAIRMERLPDTTERGSNGFGHTGI